MHAVLDFYAIRPTLVLVVVRLRI